MTYAAQRDAFARTAQDLLVIGLRRCTNFYASIIEQLLTRTDELDHADWSKTSVTVNANAAASPDPDETTNTADEVVFNATDDVISQVVTGEAVTSKAFTGSVWLRISSGTQTVQLQVVNVGFTETGTKQVTVTTTWQRFFVHKLFSATPTDDVVFRIARGAAEDVTTLEVWRANLHQNDGAKDAEVPFPSRKRTAEAASVLATNASRCQAADAGDGSRCFYSRLTCPDPFNYAVGNAFEATPELKGDREYRFCSSTAALALPGETVIPSLVKFDSAAQEIDSEKSFTRNERTRFEFQDDAAPGVWNALKQSRGALVNTQTGVGTFWRRFMKIHGNFANPDSYAIRKAGFVESGVAESDYQTRASLIMTNIELLSGGNRVRLECTDKLKQTVLKVPSKIDDDNVLLKTIDNAITEIEIVDVGEISPLAGNAAGTSPDYVVTLLLDPGGVEEYVNVTAIDLTTNKGTVQRGRWGTSAVAHTVGIGFEEVVQYGTERNSPSGVPLGKNIIDIIIEDVARSGISKADNIDVTKLQSERDTWLPSTVEIGDDILVGAFDSGAVLRRTVTEQTKIEDLITELRELGVIFMWVNDSQRVTGKVFAPPLPADVLKVLDDDSSFVSGSIGIDHNEESRVTAMIGAWDLKTDATGDKAEDYNNIIINLDLDRESPGFYGKRVVKSLLTKWVRASDKPIVSDALAHTLNRFQDGVRLLRGRLEMKDDDVVIGDYVTVNTSRLQDAHGNAKQREMMIVKKKRTRDGKIEIGALDLGILQRVFFWAPDGLPDYDSASEADKRYGYWSDSQGLVGTPKEPAYNWW